MGDGVGPGRNCVVSWSSKASWAGGLELHLKEFVSKKVALLKAGSHF